MKANIILAIVLVLGTICVVFQRQVVNFLFRYCALGKLLDRLGTCFLSRHEKELSKQEERIRNATEEELLAQWLSIVKEHAGNYNEICTVPEKLSENLPEELLKSIPLNLTYTPLSSVYMSIAFEPDESL